MFPYVHFISETSLPVDKWRGCFIHCWSQILYKWIPDTRFPCCFKPVPSRVWCRNGNHCVTLCGLQYLKTHRDDPQCIYCCPTCSYRKKKFSELRRLKLIYLWLRIWKEAVITHFKHTVSYFAWREGGKNWRPQSVFPSVTWISNRVLSEYNLQSCAASVMLSVLRNCVKRLRFSLRMCRMRLLLLWALTERKSLLLGPTHDA